ncbi:MAG: nucleotide pyrophosphohydrolase [Proteobacteria bacterium]|nr:MAG: nucleotide pyrophosphohydrolase [Pseudomonadota bacterium]
MTPESTFQAATARIVKFRNERSWQKFHRPKDMAISLMIEAAELAEHFQWKDGQELAEHLESHKGDVAHELCDVLYWVLLLAHDLGILLPEAFEAKMQLNEAKYPVELCKGRADKYSELGHGAAISGAPSKIDR